MDAAPWATSQEPWDQAGSTVRQPEPERALRYADWGERVGATLVDWALVLFAFLVAGTVLEVSETLGGPLAMVALALGGYLAWLNGSKGQSPGKALLGLKVVREADGSTLGGSVGLVRGTVLAIAGFMTGGLVFLVAGLWPLWDQRKQALHDKLVGAVVLGGYERQRLSKSLLKP